MNDIILETGSTRIAIAPFDSAAPMPAGVKRKKEREEALRLVKLLCGEKAFIDHNEEGAPQLRGAEGYISISHCASGVAVGCNLHSPIGIDIETPRQKLEHVKERFLSDAEMQFYGGSIDGLLTAWTAKEAVYKAALTPGLPLEEIRLPQPDDSVPVATVGNRSFTLTFHKIPGSTLLCLAMN